MRTLLLAAILYLIGVVAILLTRPGLMFNQAGQWKEFGTMSTDHTIFPFWLFCITWAVISYCATLFFMGIDTAPAETPKIYTAPSRSPRSGKRSKSGKRSVAPRIPSVPSMTPLEDLVEPLPPKKTVKPGYYIFNDEGTAATGKPRYVYYGTEPPELV